MYVGLKHDAEEISNVEFESDEVTGSLFNENEIEQATNKMYQIHKKYIVSSIKSGMLVINQSRAHQRILYEEFLQQITIKEGISQQLLFPLGLQFDKEEIRVLEDFK